MPTLPYSALGILFALSLAASLVFTPLARTLARLCGLVDRPDGRRKLHDEPIPVAGGLAILAAVGTTLAAVLVWDSATAEVLANKADSLLGLLLGTLTICAVGIADDFHCLRGRHKFLGQLVAVGFVIASGVRVERVQVFEWGTELGLLSVPFTVFWLLGAVNALNLLDGMDGLLGSVGLIISLAMAAMAVFQGEFATAVVAVTLAGALLGFLRHNFPPATIFLGDCGSMLIGLVVGVLAIQSALKGPATVALAAPMALLIVPIFDTTAAIVRRKLTGRSIYATDRGHLHHCLLRRGFSSRRTLGVIASLCLVTGVGAWASLAWKNEALALISAAAVVATLILTKLFGNVEMMLLRKRVTSAAASLFTGPGGGAARELQVRLQGSADWRDLWARLTECAEQLGLSSLRLDVQAPALHEGYHACWDRADGGDEGAGVWRAELPLTAYGQNVGRVALVGQRGEESVAEKIAEMAKVVEEIEAALSVMTLRHHTAQADAARPHLNRSREQVSTR